MPVEYPYFCENEVCYECSLACAKFEVLTAVFMEIQSSLLKCYDMPDSPTEQYGSKYEGTKIIRNVGKSTWRNIA